MPLAEFLTVTVERIDCYQYVIYVWNYYFLTVIIKNMLR